MMITSTATLTETFNFPYTARMYGRSPEMSGIPAHIDWQTMDFSFPNNFPFQAYAARSPVPGRLV